MAAKGGLNIVQYRHNIAHTNSVYVKKCHAGY